jgi:hypothetical protein
MMEERSAVSSRKRWHKLYEGDNPFELPRTITDEIRACAKAYRDEDGQGIEYLWIRLCEVGEHTEACKSAAGGGLDLEGWLSIIDEAASLGATAALVSFQPPIRTHRDLLDMCRWAQNTHDMMVGLHIRRRPLGEEELDLVSELDPAKTPFFADSDVIDAMRYLDASPFKLLPSEEEENIVSSGTCTLPQTVMCVSHCGTMFVCGLVICDGDFRLGHVFERKLGKVMGDDALPHEIPQGFSKANRECNGCPPLMLKRLQKSKQGG